MSQPDRRAQIVQTVLEVLAQDGARALTHRAVDRRLGLPAGSTSYYYRTRRALLEAAAAELRARARADFAASQLRTPEAGSTLDDVAAAIAGHVVGRLAERRTETVARYVLALELARDPQLGAGLGPRMFSPEAAQGLLATLGADDPEAAARGLVTLLEGYVAEQVLGSAPDLPGLTSALTTYLGGATGPKSRPGRANRPGAAAPRGVQ